MGIQTRFSIVVGVIFIIGLSIAGLISYQIELDNAQETVIQNAQLMLETAIATRGYTVNQIRPLLEQIETDDFLPQTVPSFAAHQTFDIINEQFPEYTYREAVLNPTNPRDRATAWEVEIIQQFIEESTLAELSGSRPPTGVEGEERLFLARPIQITNEACLECHSDPNVAPPNMISLYGSGNGFGWQMNEIVGIQIVTVPIDSHIENATESVFSLMVSLFSIFAILFLVINLMLRQVVIVPLNHITQIADRISRGEQNVEELQTHEKGDIGKLEQSINRMKRSMDKALQMIANEGTD